VEPNQDRFSGESGPSDKHFHSRKECEGLILPPASQSQQDFAHSLTLERLVYRPLQTSDVTAYAETLHSAFNDWYWKHGWGKDYFGCSAQETSVFYDIYNDLTPGCSIAAFDLAYEGRVAGACFYHPRPHHVSLGIMCVHPDYWGCGIGRAFVEHILAFVRSHDYPACRLVGSAINMNSFSLYNRCGFEPKAAYHDMVVDVSERTLEAPVPGQEQVRTAELSDMSAMAELEMYVSGIRRDIDYGYAIRNARGLLHATVCENAGRSLDGFMVSVRHPALNMLGPCVARTQEAALSLISAELGRFIGERVLLLVPTDKRKMVEQAYAWGAINVETHFKQVWGSFQEFNGVNMPSFLPETG
jgi:GNAT superfamily N-acetyltransferase